jgi:hypothetical protein
MSIVLADFDFEEGTINMGGTAGKVYAIPASDVETIPAAGPDGVTVATAIVCKTGKKFAEIYMTSETGEVKDVEVGERDGGSFETNLEWWSPAISAELLALKSQFANGGFIFLVKDSNNVMRIVGSKDHPAYREPGEVTTGKAPKDRRGASFKFKASSPKPALIYTGVVPLTPAA